MRFKYIMVNKRRNLLIARCHFVEINLALVAAQVGPLVHLHLQLRQAKHSLLERLARELERLAAPRGPLEQEPLQAQVRQQVPQQPEVQPLSRQYPELVLH